MTSDKPAEPIRLEFVVQVTINPDDARGDAKAARRFLLDLAGEIVRATAKLD